MPKNVLVVGMPRSGTSMTAGIFARAGYHVTDEPDDDLRSGDAGNPDGYWEAESLIERNVEVFAAVGYDCHNTWLFEPIPDEIAERIDALEPLEGHRDFVRDFDRNTPWIWKDPRLCYTLGYWWKLLDPERTRVVLTSRSAEAIYNSFLRLGWRQDSPEAREDVARRVDQHMAAATRAIEEHDIPHLVVDYERVASAPGEVAAAISSLCDIEVGAADLGFDPRFDHTSARGRLTTFAEHLVARLPAGLRRGLKRLAPDALIVFVFPERKQT